MGRASLLKSLRRIIYDKRVKDIVLRRIKSFEETRKSRDKTFSELCFCILTANYSAKGGLRIQEECEKDFFSFDETNLAEKLRKLGHRYPKSRARYIVEARRIYDEVWKTINSGKDPLEIRKWLVKNVLGLGFKEASHFLRNIGFKNLAIIDRHVLRILNKHGLVRSIPARLSESKYLGIEMILSKIAEELKVSLAELDLYLWYMDTGEVLK
ncbi:MAG: N-glycosylase/DNA lyase [Crenarchaeota archaeon]|nr:N-glycosylase/DNA lyase [Thermoproteota archaeon]MDW8034172.1 N-glycosylase/DNA lyase [Nitrososphaerota archaeon]